MASHKRVGNKSFERDTRKWLILRFQTAVKEYDLMCAYVGGPCSLGQMLEKRER